MFTVTNVFMGFPYSGYGPIDKPLEKIWKVSTLEIILTSTGTLAGTLLMTLFFNCFSKRLTIKSLCSLGLCWALAGFGLKFLIERDFWFCVAGQFLIGAGICFVINIQLSVAFAYFSPKYRSMIISLLNLSNMLGGCWCILRYSLKTLCLV